MVRSKHFYSQISILEEYQIFLSQFQFLMIVTKSDTIIQIVDDIESEF